MKGHGRGGRKNQNQLKATIKKTVRQMSETKCLFAPISVGAAISTNGNVQILNLCSQGTGVSQRIGNTIQLRRLKLSMVLDDTSPTPQQTIGRVMLFYSPTQFTSAQLQNYLTGSYDPKQYFPLYDKMLSFPRDYTGTFAVSRPVKIEITKKLRYFIKYNGTESSAIQRGYLTLCVNQLNAPNTQSMLSGRMELWYDDM